jgi:hypothetical protein
MDAVSLLVKNLTDPRVHHELLLYEGLLALVSISADEESFRERMLANGAWANCRDLLSDKNSEIATAATELMANLALSDAAERLTNFRLEVDIMCAQYMAAEIGSKMRFGVLTFLANTISIEGVQD